MGSGGDRILPSLRALTGMDWNLLSLCVLLPREARSRLQHHAPQALEPTYYWLHTAGFVCPQSHRERNQGRPRPRVALHSPLPLQVEKSLQRIQNGQRNAMYTSQQSVENKVGGIPGWQALLTAVGFRLDPPASGLPAAVFFPTSDPGDRLQHCSSTIQSLLGEPQAGLGPPGGWLTTQAQRSPGRWAPQLRRSQHPKKWHGVTDTDLSGRGGNVKQHSVLCPSRTRPRLPLPAVTRAGRANGGGLHLSLAASGQQSHEAKPRGQTGGRHSELTLVHRSEEVVLPEPEPGPQERDHTCGTLPQGQDWPPWSPFPPFSSQTETHTPGCPKLLKMPLTQTISGS